MTAYSATRRAGRPLTSISLILLYGCATPPDSTRSEGAVGIPPADGEPVATVVDARPAALVNGQSVLWGELRPILSEAAGADALSEVLLDRRATAAAREAGIVITDSEVARERELLLETLSDDPGTAVRLLDELRRRRGLGPVRFEAMLRRNATLRALVQGRVQPNDAAIEQAFGLRYGPKRQVRLLTIDSLGDAQRTLERLRSGEPFADVAVEVSTDRSAPRGGLLEPVARSDPSYPQSLVGAIWTLSSPGEISDPILLEEGYAVIQLVREIDARDVDRAAVRDELERLVRLNQERILMDRFAQRILGDAGVTIFDPSLSFSWEGR